MLLHLVFIFNLFLSASTYSMHLFPWPKQSTDHEVACTFVRDFYKMTPKAAQQKYNNHPPDIRKRIDCYINAKKSDFLSKAFYTIELYK